MSLPIELKQLVCSFYQNYHISLIENNYDYALLLTYNYGELGGNIEFANTGYNDYNLYGITIIQNCLQSTMFTSSCKFTQIHYNISVSIFWHCKRKAFYFNDRFSVNYVPKFLTQLILTILLIIKAQIQLN